MNILRPEDYQVREHAFPSHQVRVSSYRLGQTYYCTVDNVDPGAVLARSQGATREEDDVERLVPTR